VKRKVEVAWQRAAAECGAESVSDGDE
jgi:hypothetical protein